MTHKILLLEGDGIGPEIVGAAIDVINALRERFGFQAELEPALLTSGGAIDVNASAPADSVVINSSGNVGIGVTPNTWSTGKAVEVGVSGTSLWGLSSGTSYVTAGYYFNSTDKFGITGSYALYHQLIPSDGSFRWYSSTATGTAGNNATMAERMRITSGGDVLVRNTDRGSQGSLCPNGIADLQPAISCFQNATTSQEQITFRNPNGVVGKISTSGTSTSFNTSSDYRLKENIAPMTGALATVSQLNPVTYTWKADGSAGQGFIAHELQAVVPDCVTGEKDDEREVDVFDEDGNKTGTKMEPVYQGVDTSFLVATLTAAIQELKAENDTLKSRLDAVEALEARIAALEAA